MLETIVENIRTLCQLRGTSLSVIEKEAGFGVGYFARKHPDVGICKLNEIAKLLEVELKDLISETYGRDLKISAAEAEIARQKKYIEALKNG